MRFSASMATTAVLISLLGACSDGASAASTSAPAHVGKLETTLWGGDDSAYWEARDRRNEEAVAACMADKGFDYIPNVARVTIEITEDPERSTRAWVEEHGFDVVYSDVQDAPPMRPNPNDAAEALMSPEEQQAYQVALQGPTLNKIIEDAPAQGGWGADTAENGEALISYTNVDGEASTAIVPWEELGCWTESHRLDAEDPTPWQDPAHEALRDEITAFWTWEHSDPEWTALDTEWSECLAGKGYPGYENPTQARDSFASRLPSSYGMDDPAIKALGAEEIQVALADFDCRADLDYDAKSRAIDLRLQQEFYDAHRAELEAFTEAMTSS